MGQSLMRKKPWPVIALFLLAPAVGELLSGSSPPAEFFAFPGLIILPALYGSGAVLIREAARRRQKGWPSILLMGAAYGIYEEGIVVRSFFDPAWPDLGVMAWYGRWAGANWAWAVMLTVYHAVVSIAIPILLVELLFPARRREPWLNGLGLAVFSLLLASLMAFGPLAGMHAPLAGLAGCVLVAAALIAAALRWPVSAERRCKPVRPAPAGCLLGVGFVGMTGFVLAFWVLPHLGLPPLLTILQASAGLALTIALGGRAWQDRHNWAIASGGLLTWVILAVISEFDSTRADNTGGMALVGLAFAVFLTALGTAIRQREKRGQALIDSATQPPLA
jgi:hypothetical protein